MGAAGADSMVGVWDGWFHEVLSRRARSGGCCRDTLLIKQLLGEAEGVSSNWLLCRFPAKTASLKSKCHQSSAGEQPLRNLRVGRMRWFITAVIPLVLGFICGGGVVRREPLLVLFWTGTLGSGGSFIFPEGRGCVSTHHGVPKPCRGCAARLLSASPCYPSGPEIFIYSFLSLCASLARPQRRCGLCRRD